MFPWSTSPWKFDGWKFDGVYNIMQENAQPRPPGGGRARPTKKNPSENVIIISIFIFKFEEFV